MTISNSFNIAKRKSNEILQVVFKTFQVFREEITVLLKAGIKIKSAVIRQQSETSLAAFSTANPQKGDSKQEAKVDQNIFFVQR